MEQSEKLAEACYVSHNQDKRFRCSELGKLYVLRAKLCATWGSIRCKVPGLDSLESNVDVKKPLLPGAELVL